MADTNDLVSIIVPAYNAEKYIADAIESVLRQTYPYFELIIVDDALTDRTAEVVQSFSDQRIKLMLNKDFKEVMKLDSERGKVYFLGQEFEGNVIFTGMIDDLFEYKF